MSLCDTLCVQCPEKGIFPVNFSGYHKVCASHIPLNTVYLTCSRCDSEIFTIQEFLICTMCKQSEIVKKCNCGSLLCANCQVSCLACSQGYCSVCLPNRNIPCENCQEFNRTHCMGCKKSNEPICLLCNKHNCNPKITRCRQCNKKCCVDCINDSNICNSCNRSSATLTARKKNDPKLKCEFCNSFEEVILRDCGHKLCSSCIKNRCRLCTQSKSISFKRGGNEVNNIEPNKCCSFCKNPEKDLKKHGDFKLCTECNNKFIKSNPKSDQVCSNCGEIGGLQQNFSCKHNGCSNCCQKNENCYKCYIKKKKHINLTKQICIYCNKSKCFSLFCGHDCCLQCSSDYKIKKLNFVCKFCLFTTNKRCLKCKNFTIWIESDENKYIESSCCKKKVCGICFKPETFFGCSCEFQLKKSNIKSS